MLRTSTNLPASEVASQYRHLLIEKRLFPNSEEPAQSTVDLLQDRDDNQGASVHQFPHVASRAQAHLIVVQTRVDVGTGGHLA